MSALGNGCAPRVVKLRRGLLANQFGDVSLISCWGARTPSAACSPLAPSSRPSPRPEQHVFTVAVDDGRAARGQKAGSWAQTSLTAGSTTGRPEGCVCKLDHDRIVRCEGKIGHETRHPRCGRAVYLASLKHLLSCATPATSCGCSSCFVWSPAETMDLWSCRGALPRGHRRR